ncbi:MAG: CDP-diacylglycerol--glycerol-3-phosphate 3-phosphatidyltransferase [Deltaproteobacteria bacterium]|jgi:CDP-diacylglycerol--glycerol-3-phosphate 3-phosphatidyltransferase|nr:CDP-diacylglycerol--glycerol-3-phosphate 3-phosphatidyltransferase [Deltaproteobacteria bacterium]
MEEATPKRASIREDAINLPNLLTMLRIALIPGVLFLLWEGTPKSNFWAAILYIGTALTDLIDGYLARKWGQISVLGKFLDPLADKLLVMATLIWLAYLGRLPFLGVVAVIIMLGRELSITALRTIAISEGVVMAAMRAGKDKTALQMVAILMLIVHQSYTVYFGFYQTEFDFAGAGLVLLYISLGLALFSAGEYFKLFVDAVDAKEERLTQAAS